MRVAVSDFDGTLKREGVVSAEDLAAIIRWREAGNKFGLATGRDLGMTVHELDRYGLGVDFLVCLNGAAIYDGAFNLLQGEYIDDDVVPAVLRHPACDASLHLVTLGDELLKIFFRGKESWYLKMDIPYNEVSYETILKSRKVRQISLGYIGSLESGEWARQLNLQFAGKCIAHPNANTIDVNPAGTDKSQGVRDMLALMDWHTAEVLVLGDGGNDLGMITTYKGATLPNATPELKKVASRVVGSIVEFLEP